MGLRRARGALCLLALWRPLAAVSDVAVYSMPGDISWSQARQPPLSPRFYLETVDFDTDRSGIRPVEPRRIAVVPPLPAALAGADSLAAVFAQLDRTAALSFASRDLNWTAEQLEALQAFWDSSSVFGRNVAQADILAIRSTLVFGRQIREGEVLVAKGADLPRSPARVVELRQAGVVEVPVLVNVADSFPKPTSDVPPDSVVRKFNKATNLTLLANWETPLLRVRRFELEPARVFDGVAETGFRRVDTPEADVLQKFRMWVDLGNYFPVALVRLFNVPGDGFTLKAYTLYAGVPDTERLIAGLNYERAGNLGFPQFRNVADTFPVFVIIDRAPANTADTVAVRFSPPSRLRYLRLDVDTDLDYTLSEFQVFADGYLPRAAWVTAPLSLPNTARATLGRVFWEEEALGDPSKSRVAVSFQTGENTEPDIFFRFNDFGDEIEWRSTGAQVVDRRRDSRSFGQAVDLNSEQFRNDAREIFSALSDSERFAVRIPRQEYIGIPGNARAKVEPDLVFWSGVQPATNGAALPAPGGNRFFQFRVDFFSDDPRAARIVRNLRFEYDTQRAARAVVGEIAPSVGVRAGIDTLFAFALRAELDSRSRGFNRIQVRTPARITGVEQVSLDPGDGQVRVLAKIEAGEPGSGQFREEVVEDGYFVVSLARVAPPAAGETAPMVRMRFRGRVIDFNTTFRSSVFLDTLGARDRTLYTANGLLALRDVQTGVDTVGLVLPQDVRAPVVRESVVDFAAENQLEDHNSLSVIAEIGSQGKELVDNVRLSPNPFTPNGDGVNDVLTVQYDVLRLIAAGPVGIAIYDLSGRRVRALQDDVELTSGGYSAQWRGVDDAGRRVPPGLYLVRIAVDADDRESADIRPVAVAY